MGSSAWRKRRNFLHRGAVKKARARVYNDALHACSGAMRRMSRPVGPMSYCSTTTGTFVFDVWGHLVKMFSKQHAYFSLGSVGEATASSAYLAFVHDTVSKLLAERWKSAK
jgi:hypothetical protein